MLSIKEMQNYVNKEGKGDSLICLEQATLAWDAVEQIESKTTTNNK